MKKPQWTEVDWHLYWCNIAGWIVVLYGVQLAYQGLNYFEMGYWVPMPIYTPSEHSWVMEPKRWVEIAEAIRFVLTKFSPCGLAMTIVWPLQMFTQE